MDSDAPDTPPLAAAPESTACLPGEPERHRLRADVAVMRELCVVQWGTILLGPAPVHRDAEKVPDAEEERERRRRIALGAASGLRRVKE